MLNKKEKRISNTRELIRIIWMNFLHNSRNDDELVAVGVHKLNDDCSGKGPVVVGEGKTFTDELLASAGGPGF